MLKLGGDVEDMGGIIISVDNGICWGLNSNLKQKISFRDD